MFALLVYLAIALGFSFLCSIAEAVLLSTTTAYIRLHQEEGKAYAKLLRKMKADIDRPLAAILTLNTIAHTAGAAGVGYQAASVFGDKSLGVVSAILTLLILIFSEIIPKTLGTQYWRQLAPVVAYTLKYLTVLLAPFVWISKKITGRLAVHQPLRGFSRDEFAAMATLGAVEGELSPQEAKILQNVFKLRALSVRDVMTPAVMMFALPKHITVDVFFHKYERQRFSRIPVYGDDREKIDGFVLRNDLLKAKARDNGESILENYIKDILVVPDKLSLLSAFELSIENSTHIMIVVNEYGVLKGLITLEDILETLMGLEIVDEQDQIEDLQKLARNRWLKRAREMGIELPDDSQ
jgi:magnesium and cobalt exporter, CNNM family